MAHSIQNAIRWDQHKANLQAMFSNQWNQGRFCDILLAGDDGQPLRAHRNVLCANSEYFDRCLRNANVNNDTLIIVKECQQDDIRLVIEFMYNGMINVDSNKIQSLHDTAKRLEVKGLVEALNGYTNNVGASGYATRSTDGLRKHPRMMGLPLPPPHKSNESTTPMPSENALPVQKWDQNFDNILTNQEKVFTLLAGLQSKVDSLMRTNTVAPSAGASTSQIRSIPTATQQRRKLTLIRTAEELDALEENLKEDSYWSDMFVGMKSICGVNSGTAGLNCSYLLIDHFFSRDFMNQCSWGGGSRTPETTKIAFKTYERTIRLFFALVHLADPTFTEEQLYHFLQAILKNSKKRCLNNPKRRSAMKRRPTGTGGNRTQTYRPDASMQVDGSNCGFVFGDTATYSVEEYSNDNSGNGDYEEDDTQEDQGDEDEYVIGHPFKEEGTEEMHGNTGFAGPSWRHQGV